MPNPPQSMIIVQHCQSEHHGNGLTGGWTDTPLTPLGRKQAARVAARLAHDLAGAHCRLYTSDLLRAAQTAEAISQSLGLPAIPAPALREFNNGIAAGLRATDAAQLEAPMPPTGPGIDHQPFSEAETWRQFYHRTAGFLDELPNHLAADSTTPILVTHGGAVINIITWWLGLGVEKLAKISFGTAPGGITALTTNQWNERVLKTLSDINHLKD